VQPDMLPYVTDTISLSCGDVSCSDCTSTRAVSQTIYRGVQVYAASDTPI